MASTINASTTSTTGLVQTADASGILQLQSDGVTGLTVGAGGAVTLANTLAVTGNTTFNNKVLLANTALSTASAGTLEYNGSVPFFTPSGTQRGVIPGMQYYVLNSALVGADSTAPQNILGVGVTLSSNTFYAFEGCYNFFKTAGSVNHIFSLRWGGTATFNRIVTNVLAQMSPDGYVTWSTTRAVYTLTMESVGPTAVTNSQASAFMTVNIQVRGIISVNAGGTLIPQYSLSQAPGGAYTSSTSNYLSIWPIGAAGSNVSVGTWA